mmetsp:Transcript_33493/g.32562  ORF Transcript_33493/g.32562 Transcript_33493/m.32562 type:complete len:90 (-) Transcript_33493:472-741(-)|eukprot:CAMPEP_0170549828 /NCGR_PEP_ID=MMETSP0211-20121228/7962_1 /TAXON_ID=311385 /ORGANISM="Pseudokeronopsis sp., Strain OXSARD2" /LENGTH=89 /DNA_ID=CAMNT_0010856069 /DNA_START=294 /DNA_END=563 /DNA_ORIENTATION=+
MREIIQKFNESLNKYTLEKQELAKKIKQLVEKIEDKCAIVRKMYSERENYIMDIEHVNLQIDELDRKKCRIKKQIEDEYKIKFDFEELD